jgi:hypothetical protein
MNTSSTVENHRNQHQKSIPLRWLRQYATSQKVVGSNSGEVIGFLIRHHPSRRTMTLGLTQPLTEMSARNLPGGKKRPPHKVETLAAICEPNV